MLKKTYYSRLSSTDKKIYNEIVDGLRRRKKRIKVIEMPSMELFYSIIDDNPDLFYWDLKRCGFEENIFGKYVLAQYLYPKALSDEIDARAERIVKAVCNGDEEQTVRIIHNYMVKEISYDKQGMLDVENHSIVGPLINSKGVCEGISRAFQFLLRKCGIDCTVLEGILEGERHMWNIVSINGYNYHIDVTSDISMTEKKWKKPSYFYYMLTDNEIKETHKFNGNYGCFQTKDNPFYKTGRVFNNSYDLGKYLSGISKRQRVINFKFVGNLSVNDIYEIGKNNIQMGLFSNYLELVSNAGTYYFYR